MDGPHCGRPDVVWTGAAHGDDVFATSTGFFVSTQAAESLQQFISSPRGDDPSIFVLLDAPGMGKTSTVARAARASRCAYVRLQGGSGMLSSALIHLQWLLRAHAHDGLLSGELAQELAMRVWTVAFIACMRRMTESVQAGVLHMDLDDNNGVNWTEFDHDVAALQPALASAQAALTTTLASHTGPDTRAMFHFDEIQQLLPAMDGDAVQQHRPPTPCAPQECMRYALVWFSAALRRALDKACIRVALTGISGGVHTSLRFDSGMKFWPARPLPYFTPAMVVCVLRAYVHISDGALENAIAAGAQGCPRVVQHVLLQLSRWRRDGWAGGCSTWTATDLLHSSRDLWRSNATGSFLQATASHLDAVQQAVLAAAFPEDVSAEETIVDGIPAITMPLLRVPLAWRTASAVGAIRMRAVGASDVVIFPPYPFLEHYLNSLDSKRLAVHNCVDLVTRAREAPRSSGAFARGHAFQLAVALEICIPTSPLWRHLIDAMHELGVRVGPLRCTHALSSFRTVTELAEMASPAILSSAAFSAQPLVFFVIDGARTGSENRPCDIAVPVVVTQEDGQSIVQLAMLEIKCSTATQMRDRLTYRRRGLASFLAVRSSHAAAPWPISCYACNVNLTPHGAVSSTEALRSYNTEPHGRKMCLLHLDDELLARCTLNLQAVLHSDMSAADTSPHAWCVMLFSDKSVQARVSAAGAAAWIGRALFLTIADITYQPFDGSLVLSWLEDVAADHGIAPAASLALYALSEEHGPARLSSRTPIERVVVHTRLEVRHLHDESVRWPVQVAYRDGARSRAGSGMA